jgi:hypothetical protein
MKELNITTDIQSIFPKKLKKNNQAEKHEFTNFDHIPKGRFGSRLIRDKSINDKTT